MGFLDQPVFSCIYRRYYSKCFVSLVFLVDLSLINIFSILILKFVTLSFFGHFGGYESLDFLKVMSKWCQNWDFGSIVSNRRERISALGWILFSLENLWVLRCSWPHSYISSHFIFYGHGEHFLFFLISSNFTKSAPWRSRFFFASTVGIARNALFLFLFWEIYLWEMYFQFWFWNSWLCLFSVILEGINSWTF